MFERMIVLVACLCISGVASAEVRTYYIAADEVAWDYAPSGMNQISGEEFSDFEAHWAVTGPHRIGTEYKKAIYREYTDDTFTELVVRPPEWEHLGINGPLIRANVGDTIRVVFRNNASFPASLHPHGVFYDKDSEGALYEDGTSGADVADDGVPQGGTHIYERPVPERAGPREGGPSTALWMYHSHVDEIRDVNSGLFGPMIIGTNEMSPDGGRPTDVDREFVVGFYTTIENFSWYLEENIATYMTDPEGVQIARNPGGGIILVAAGDEIAQADVNIMDNMNGYVYGNQPMMTMHMGERVRWYVMASSNFEVHAAHWHGNTLDVGGVEMDTIPLITMEMAVADMVPDNPGIWLFHCHVGGHMIAGMINRYEVLP